MTTFASPAISPTHNMMSINGQFQKLNVNDNIIKFIKNHNHELIGESNYENKNIENIKMSYGIKRQLSEIPDCKNNIILNKFPLEILSKAKSLVQEAIKKNMIFSIYGPYDKVRYILRERGWVEKRINDKRVHSTYLKLKSSELDSVPNVYGDIANMKELLQTDLDQEANPEKENNDIAIIHKIASQLVSDCVPDFIWSLKMSQIDMQNIKSNQLINHFRKAGSFTTKIGLIKSFNFLQWFEKNPDKVFPRSYIISDEDEKKAFLNDYYLTACLSLLRLTAEIKDVVSKIDEIEDNNTFEEIESDSNNSKFQIKKVKPVINYNNKESVHSQYMIDRRYPEMAIHYCQLYLKNLANKDLDSKDIAFCTSRRWEDFFTNFWNVTFEGYGIQCTDSIRSQCRELCIQYEKVYLQYNLNGTKNIWIVKPGAKSRGRGISCISKFAEFNNLIKPSSEILIVQKYIERPFLVYNTKFDIRQWFLVTNWSPLTIWWYKDSYIRFCSQQFTLNDFNESIHLSNNSIQHKYENGIRSKNLPSSNMWTWQSLEGYLNEHGYENGWKQIILPSMKNIIIDILLCSQEEIEDRKNSFELYGADFMVTENDLKTWLLEINSSPCMAPSTDVTARLTKSVLEDLIKVVLDYPKDVYCDTGQFELLYLQSPFSKSIIDSSNELSIIGSSIKKPIMYSCLSSQEFGKQNRKLLHDENSVLKYKLRQVIENCGNMQNKYFRTNEYIKKYHNRAYTKLAEEIKSSPKDISNSNPDAKSGQISINCQNITNNIDSYKPQVAYNLTNYKITKSNLNRDDYQESNLPIIKSSVVKSHDRNPFKVKKQITDKYTKTGNSYENTIAYKINSLRASEANANNKRIDQLIKAYMPNLGNQ